MNITAFLGLVLVILAAFSGLVRADYSCVDNYTIKYSTNISVDGIDIPVIQTELCENGCDNTTASCSPSPGYTYVYVFILIIVACFAGYKFLRWIR